MHLCEMALKEGDLMLEGRLYCETISIELYELHRSYIRGIRCCTLQREVVVQRTDTEVGFGLRNQLGSLHLRVPRSGRIDGHLEAERLASDCWVLVLSTGIQVVRGRLAAVYVPLVGSDLVGPRP